jgi:hypothetical protein
VPLHRVHARLTRALPGRRRSATGQTRVNVSSAILFNGAPLAAGATLVAHLHAGRCSASPPGGGHYLQDPAGVDDALSAPLPAGSAQGSNTFSVRVRSGVSSAVQPFLTDYDRTLSVVLHEGAAVAGYAPTAVGSRAACCDLVPNLPDLPETWSATIECNFGLSKAYTMIRQEFFSSSMNKVALVQHTNLLRSVQVQDLTKNMSYELSQNATYPNGLCVAKPIPQGMANPLLGSNGQLKSTADFLQFDPSQPISFDGMNVKNVRGITCERWSRNFSFPFGARGAGTCFAGAACA